MLGFRAHALDVDRGSIGVWILVIHTVSVDMCPTPMNRVSRNWPVSICLILITDSGRAGRVFGCCQGV